MSLSVFITSHSPDQTRQLGKIIGEMAHPADVVLLSGPLGAGKTCLTQGIAKALGVHETITSPSYVLLREFCGRIPLYHLDLYRLDLDEISELGLDDYLYGQGLCVIEWAEKGRTIMPEQHLQLVLNYGADSTRLIQIVSCGERYNNMAEQLSYLAGSSSKKDLS